MHILGIDADPLVYEAGFAVQRTHYDVSSKGHLIGTFDNATALNKWLKEVGKKKSDFSMSEREEVEPLSHATGIIDGKIIAMLKDMQPEQVFLYLTSTEKGVNFREYIAKTKKYKDRKGKRPKYYKELRDHLIHRWEAKVVVGYEADDAVAMLQWGAIDDNQSCCIATIDKDLDMIPGWHYNYQKKKMSWVTAEEAEYAFYSQLLTGDQCDTIPGVPKIGPVKAKAALDGCKGEKDLFVAAQAIYQEKYGSAWEWAMIEQGRLLWMLRYPGERWFPPGAARKLAESKMSPAEE